MSQKNRSQHRRTLCIEWDLEDLDAERERLEFRLAQASLSGHRHEVLAIDKQLSVLNAAVLLAGAVEIKTAPAVELEAA
jgi:hypothetical protein